MTSPERVILRGAALIDGAGGPAMRGLAVVVEDGRIAAVVPESQAPDGRVLRLDGHTLLPGLVNCHVHLCLGGEPDPLRALETESFATIVIRAVVRARQTVEAGVTTVRDLGGLNYAQMAVRDAARSGLVPGPRILTAGKGICMTGGHGWRWGREADGPDDMRRAVREQLRAGADVVKLFASGGVMTPGVEPQSPQLTLEELRAGIEEARKAGRRAAAHAQATEGIATAVEAGITSIEHGIFLTPALAERMARERIALVATLIAPQQILTRGPAAGVPEYMVRKSREVIDRHLESFRMALAAGVPIAAGTDAGTPFNPHGSLVPELGLMVKAGMTPLEAIRSATSVAAWLLGLEGVVGRVAPGLAADLIAVGGDPAEAIEALDDVRLVLAGGRAIVNRLGRG